MANTTDLSNPLVVNLFRTREKLLESEAEFGRVHAEYAKLECIARKQLKMRLSTLPSDNSAETKSVSSIGSKNKAQRTSSISSKQSICSTSKRFSSIPLVNSESTRSSLKESESKEISEQAVNTLLVKRITQFHENVESLENLYEKPVAEKAKFLKHLQRLVSLGVVGRIQIYSRVIYTRKIRL